MPKNTFMKPIQIRYKLVVAAWVVCWIVLIVPTIVGLLPVIRDNEPYFILEVFPRIQPAEASEAIPSAPMVANLDLNAKRENILEEGARKEGALMVYSAASGMDPVVKGFMRKYDFIKTEVFRTRTQSLIERTQIEARAGRLGGDVFVGGIRPYVSLKALLTPYKSRSADFSVVPTAGVTSITLIIFAYNTKQVAPGEVPKKLEDLISQRWKQKLGFYGPPNTFPGLWTGMLEETRGEKYTVKFLDQLSQQSPFLYTSGSVGMRSIVTGEVDIGANTTSTALSAKKSGSPVDWVALEPTMAIINVAGIFRDSRHPHAAMLFLEYLLGPEGQKITEEKANFLTMDNIKNRRAWGVKLPGKIRLESPGDGKRFPQWNKLFLQHVVKKN